MYINVYRNAGSDGSTRHTTTDYHWKSMESWVGTTNLVFCSGYNAPILFRNLQQRTLACREHGTLQTRYHSQAFHIITWHPLTSRRFNTRHPGTRWAAMWVGALGTFPSFDLHAKRVLVNWNNGTKIHQCGACFKPVETWNFLHRRCIHNRRRNICKNNLFDKRKNLHCTCILKFS